MNREWLKLEKTDQSPELHIGDFLRISYATGDGQDRIVEGYIWDIHPMYKGRFRLDSLPYDLYIEWVYVLDHQVHHCECGNIRLHDDYLCPECRDLVD